MTSPEQTPATVLDPAERTMHIPDPPRRRGRPAGSRNKPKESESFTPAQDGPSPRPATRAPSAKGKKDYRPQLNGMLLLIGDTVEQLVNPVDGQIIKAYAGNVAEGWNRLAQDNANVAKILDSMLTGSAWSAALMPTLGMAMAIAANHGALNGLGARIGGMMGSNTSDGGVASEDATASGDPTD